MSVTGLAEYLAQVSSVRTPFHLQSFTAMLSFAERAALYKIGRDHYTGRGVIVDGGAFLGGSAAAFAEGMKAAGRTRRHAIRSYELGLCDRFMAQAFKDWLGLEMREGDSFAALLERNLEPYGDLIDLRLGDIHETAIVETDPVEVLFLDVCKSAEINAFVTRHFFPQLRPGESLLVQQDFYSGNLPWLHMTLGQFADRLECLGSADSTMFYRLRAPIGAEEAARDPWTTMPTADAMACFERAIPTQLSPDQKYQLDLCRAIALYYRDEQAAAREALHRLELPAPSEQRFSFALDARFADDLRRRAAAS